MLLSSYQVIIDNYVENQLYFVSTSSHLRRPILNFMTFFTTINNIKIKFLTLTRFMNEKYTGVIILTLFRICIQCRYSCGFYTIKYLKV